jgi:hypothetical protein
MFDREAHERRVRWFEEARLGMFIHWGLICHSCKWGMGEEQRKNIRWKIIRHISMSLIRMILILPPGLKQLNRPG